ncbi:beta-propeller fold lactonase family protein [Variovorax sp. IB41]|nr:beta-propeller fold lactonase family protein [Variovorax sp. IB41]
MPAMPLVSRLRLALFVLVPLALASCGGGGGGGGFSFFPFPPPSTAAKYAVGGNVSGLQGSGLVLQLAGATDLAVTANGAFVFSEKLDKGASYAVSVKQQPSTPSQTCTVNNASGTIGNADVANVAVVCATTSQKVSVAVTGLDAAGGLVLQNNAGDDLAVSADGTFSFATPVAVGADYGVTVKTQPTALQVCIAKQAFGTVTTAPIASVTIACTTPGADRFAFTANEGTSDVSMYIVNSDGSLTDAGRFPVGGTPQHVTTHPSKPYIYASNISGATRGVIQYTIDTTTVPTGTLTQQRAITAGVGTNPYFVGIAPNGQHAYVIGDGMLHTLDVDPNTGELTGGTAVAGGVSRKIGLDPQGRFAFVVVNGNSLAAFRLDPATGAPISPPASVALPGSSGLTDIAIEPTGRFAYANVGNNPGTLLAYAIDATTGALTQIGSVPAGNTPFGMAIDPSGRFLYAANRNSNNVSAYSIDPRTGALTPVPGQPFAAGNVPNSVTVDRTGRFAYTANQADNTITFFTIDRATGSLGTGVRIVSSGGGPQFLALTK